MEKDRCLELMKGFGLGNFLEEVDNSYKPDESFKMIFERIREDILFSVKKDPKVSYWADVAEALLLAKDICTDDELDKMLRFEYNLFPSAVGGATEFFTRVSNMLTGFIEEANRIQSLKS